MSNVSSTSSKFYKDEPLALPVISSSSEVVPSESPVEYNGVQLVPHAASLAIDTLKLSFKGTIDSLKPEGHYELADTEHSNKYFGSIYKLIYKGAHLGNVLTNSKGVVKNFTHLEILNYYLYDSSNTVELVNQFAASFGLSFYSINRIDIAYDFNTLLTGDSLPSLN